MSDANSAPVASYLRAPRGVLSWLLSIDHKRIAVLYLGLVFLFLLIGGALGVMLHLEHWAPKEEPGGMAFDVAGAYNRAFTMHGILMMYVVILPCVYVPFGLFLLPLMLGTENFVFPRLNLAGLYLYALGSLVVFVGASWGGLEDGYNFYTLVPLPIPGGAYAALAGAGLVCLSLNLISINFFLTIRRHWTALRRRNRVPHFVWACYSTALAYMVTTPLACFLGPTPDEKLGDPGVVQDIVMSFGRFLPILFFFPALGIVFEVISVHGRLSIFENRRLAAVLLLNMALPVVAAAVPALAQWSVLQGVGMVIGIVSLTFWLRALYRGNIQRNVAGWYAAFYIMISILVVGAVNGVPNDLEFKHDTLHLIGRFHYAVSSVAFIVLFGALHHWWPKIAGRLVREPAAKVGAIAVFVGLNITFLGEVLLGLNGMPRRYWTHLPEFQGLHRLAAVGAIILAAGVVWVLICLFASLRRGPDAPANPWGGRSLEWQAASPPIPRNFADFPVVAEDPYDFRGADSSAT